MKPPRPESRRHEASPPVAVSRRSRCPRTLVRDKLRSRSRSREAAAIPMRDPATPVQSRKNTAVTPCPRRRHPCPPAATWTQVSRDPPGPRFAAVPTAASSCTCERAAHGARGAAAMQWDGGAGLLRVDREQGLVIVAYGAQCDAPYPACRMRASSPARRHHGGRPTTTKRASAALPGAVPSRFDSLVFATRLPAPTGADYHEPLPANHVTTTLRSEYDA